MSPRRGTTDLKPHYWKEHGKWKVRHGVWIFVGFDLNNCHQNYLYWSMQSNEKPS